MNFNVIFLGNLGADPELKNLDNGHTVCNFSVAANRRWKGSAGGEPVEETTWYRVAAWGPLAEVCHQYLHKGSPVFVIGRLVPDRETGGPKVWLDSTGKPRGSFDVTAVEVKFLGNRGDSPGDNNHESRPVSDCGDDGLTEDEIPF